MNKSVQYWIPRGLPEHLQVALSIPGEPPKTVREHRNRFEGLLIRLGEETDEQLWKGAAAQEAYDVIPDQALYLEGENASPNTVVQILMQSDFFTNSYLPANCLGPGVADEDLQERCEDSMFIDRLVCLTQFD